MKGYSYPGKSPLKEKGDPSAGDQSKYQDQPEETVTSKDIPNEQTGKTTLEKRAKRKQYLGDLGEQAAMALVTGGINAGINALTRSKKKKTRRSTGNGGFTSINFGRK